MVAPVVLHDFKSDHEDLILASRSGEPNFVWVQDFSDACQAAAARGAELHVPAALYEHFARPRRGPALAARDGSFDLTVHTDSGMVARGARTSA